MGGSAKLNITAAVIELEEGEEELDDVVAAPIRQECKKISNVTFLDSVHF